jgi:ion channel POLLUX/CASTOR
VNFYTVVEAARQRGEIAIGYRRLAEAANVTKHYGIHLNPVKAEGITFADGDRVIVLSKD